MKDLKIAQQAGVVPWDNRLFETDSYVVFQDRYPVTVGHLLFVPKVNYIDDILNCYRAAHQYGQWMVLRQEAQGYNVGMNMGPAAGQTIMYPHIHLIPRRLGDCPDPVGGVRGVIAGQANYKTPDYKQPS
jgi:diadenosine tetraphosphate (Ap4A) HIT family hydrolase